MELLRLSVAARRVGLHPDTLRTWADMGKVGVVWVGRERRFPSAALELLVGGGEQVRERREALYVRVSGTTGRESSLGAQEAELRASACGEVVAVFRDRASGMRERRPGLDRLLKRAQAREFTHLRVTHEDRLARFGAAWITTLLARDRVAVEVLHPDSAAPGDSEELLTDFMYLVASFSGRLYGIRSRQARRRLLAAATPAPAPAPAKREV
ncbi:IS607 family transposase [Streptomyces sp. AC512_CC834]|uniref:IS607 family transposase n=1 Tax=Streptomyces sp. AC512_CC834 TaxID=2823691 RepID=UPI001C251A92|nr:IS607 family transposase [Streptomyces sp. AC512_CC834]